MAHQLQKEKNGKPPMRTVAKDGILHIPIGKKYAGYVLLLHEVEEKVDELVLRLKIVKRPNIINTSA